MIQLMNHLLLCKTDSIEIFFSKNFFLQFVEMLFLALLVKMQKN